MSDVLVSSDIHAHSTHDTAEDDLDVTSNPPRKKRRTSLSSAVAQTRSASNGEQAAILRRGVGIPRKTGASKQKFQIASTPGILENAYAAEVILSLTSVFPESSDFCAKIDAIADWMRNGYTCDRPIAPATPAVPGLLSQLKLVDLFRRAEPVLLNNAVQTFDRYVIYTHIALHVTA